MPPTFRNMSKVPRVLYGIGAFEKLNSVLLSNRRNAKAPFIFLVDDVFLQKFDLTKRIPCSYDDQIIFVSTVEEPTTVQVDDLVQQIILNYEELPSGVIGIGGGSVMDLAKAVALLLTNKGSASDYQGWDLVHNPGVYSVGIPTLSGTGAEVSRTAVLKGPELKLGINSDFTPFDQVILDPMLTAEVPKNQWFYTGMDCYIHCVESLNGTFLNAFSQAHGEKALMLCENVFLNSNLTDLEKSERLMMASWLGGISIANSQVGIVHALSYGLSFVLGIKHGLGNCMAIEHLEQYYSEGVKVYRKMKDTHQIDIPSGVCEHLSEKEYQQMTKIALSLNPLWENALGKNWKSVINEKVVRELYEKM